MRHIIEELLQKKSQDVNSISVEMINIICIFEKIPRFFKIPYQIFWVLIFSIISSTMIFFSSSVAGGKVDFLFPLTILLGAAHISISIVWSSKRLAHLICNIDSVCADPICTKKWLIPFCQKVYSTKFLLLGGFILSSTLVLLVGLSSGWYSQPYEWYDTLQGKILFTLIWYITTFIAGCGIMVIIGTMLIPIRLAKDKLRLTLHTFGKFGIQLVGNFFFSFTMIISVASIIGVSGILVSPVAGNIYIILMGAFFLIIPITYFITTQWHLHLTLIEDKAKLLSDISSLLEDELYAISSSNYESRERINGLLNLRKEMLLLSEWPFDSGTIIKAIMSSLGPLLILASQYWEQIARFFGWIG